MIAVSLEKAAKTLPEWNNLQETIRLLKDKKSLKALLDGHKSREEGNRPVSISLEEAFRD